jgi:hypothetical protein
VWGLGWNMRKLSCLALEMVARSTGRYKARADL